MTKRTAFIGLFSAIAPALLLWGQMRHSQVYEPEMQDPVEDPPDAVVQGGVRFRAIAISAV